MTTDTEKEKIELAECDVTDKILDAAFKVQNALGIGFLEKVRGNAMVVELSRSGIA
mgnify:FL=1